MYDKYPIPELEKYRECPMAVAQHSVAFSDIDAMHVVWHGHYAKYFEIARDEVLREIGYDYVQMKVSGYTWPVVDLRGRFISPLQYNDQIQIAAVISEWEIRLVIKYWIWKKSDFRITGRGSTVQVPVSEETHRMELGCPNIVKQRINHWRRTRLL